MHIAAKIVIPLTALLILTLVVFAKFMSPAFTIRTETVLPASIEHSWQALSNFKKYPQWNPYLISVVGEFLPGEKITATLVDGNFDKPTTVYPRMELIEANKRFCWRGILLVPGLFDTRHCFVLHALSATETRLAHYEEFGGIIPRLVPAQESMTPETTRAFQLMNEALVQLLQNN